MCGYRYQITPNELLFTNSVFIAGRLDDGSTVLDFVLSNSKTGLLAEEVQRLERSITAQVCAGFFSFIPSENVCTGESESSNLREQEEYTDRYDTNIVESEDWNQS